MASTAPSSNTSVNDAQLRAATFQRLHPRAYFERFVAENVRPDGRAFTGYRAMSSNIGSISTANGSALVRLGDTAVVCGVKAEIAEPELDKPDQGFLVPNLDLPAICSPKFKPGPPTEEAQTLSERLNEAIIASGMFDLTTLCIEPGKSVWVLYVDATCINYDGNAFDAALAAMVTALKNTHLPVARFDDEKNQTICSKKKTTPLTILQTPIATSFGIFDATHLIADPTAFEEPLLDTTITILLDEDGSLVSVTQLGSGTLSTQDVLSTCTSIARSRLQQTS